MQNRKEKKVRQAGRPKMTPLSVESKMPHINSQGSRREPPHQRWLHHDVDLLLLWAPAEDHPEQRNVNLLAWSNSELGRILSNCLTSVWLKSNFSPICVAMFFRFSAFGSIFEWRFFCAEKREKSRKLVTKNCWTTFEVEEAQRKVNLRKYDSSRLELSNEYLLLTIVFSTQYLLFTCTHRLRYSRGRVPASLPKGSY